VAWANWKCFPEVVAQPLGVLRLLDRRRDVRVAVDVEAELHVALLFDRELEQLADDGVQAEVPDALEVLGGLALDAGRPADGVRLLVAGRSAHAALGGRGLHGVAVEADLDRAVRALGTEGPPAVAAAQRLDVGAAVALARRGRGARKRPPTGWDGLTPTERQVVLLVAEGLSNPEIAGRLFVSRATVKTHLAHAFAKLGVTSRAQLAVVAARRS